MKYNFNSFFNLYLVITISVISGNFISDYLIKKVNKINPPVRAKVTNLPRPYPTHTNVVQPSLNNQELCDFWTEHLIKNDNPRNRELKRRACSR